MNKKLINWWIGSGSSYNAGYQAILDMATALGYTHPTTPAKTLQNQLYIDLGALGFWDTYMDVFRCYAHDGAAGFGLINWANPNAFLGTMPAGDLTFTSKVGFTSGGGTKYVSDNYNPSTDGVKYLAGDCSVFYYQQTANTVSTPNGHLQGSGGTTGMRFQPQRSGNILYADINNISVFSGTAQTTTTGMFSLMHFEGIANEFAVYRGGTFFNGTSSGTPATRPNETYRNAWYGDAKSGCMGYGKDFRGIVSSVNTIISTYMTAIAAI